MWLVWGYMYVDGEDISKWSNKYASFKLNNAMIEKRATQWEIQSSLHGRQPEGVYNFSLLIFSPQLL